MMLHRPLGGVQRTARGIETPASNMVRMWGRMSMAKSAAVEDSTTWLRGYGPRYAGGRRTDDAL